MNDAASSQNTAPSRRLSGFSLARQWRLTRKELAETLRDRRTIITLLLMPVLVYPLLSIIFRQFLVKSLGQSGQVVIVAVEDDSMYERLSGWLSQGEAVLKGEARIRGAVVDASAIEPPLVEEPTQQNLRFDIGDVEQKLKDGHVDMAVKRLQGDDQRAPGPGIELVYPERSPVAVGLRSFIERRIRAYNLLERQRAGLPAESEVGLTMLHQPIAVGAAQRSILPSIVPLVLLLMTITGAVYPAIDLTAGERERGTLEALIAAPVSRMGVLMAKYIAVLTVALLTAGMNLAAMSVTIYSAGLSSVLVSPGQNVVVLAIQLLGLLLLFASFFSAVLLAVTSFARSFKEAQAYLIPLMLVTLGPGLLSLSPTLELSGPLAVTPLVNVVLLARDVFSGGASLVTTLAVVVSTALYAAVSIALAARIFGSDAILYGSEGSWSDLFRRPKQTAAAPGLVAALLCVALVFAAMINLGGAGSLLAAEASPRAQLLISSLMTALIFAGIPLIAAALENVQIAEGFRMRAASLAYWIAAVLLGFSVGLLVIELTALGLQWEVTTIHEALEEAIKKKAAELNALPLPLVLLTLAIVPAVAEELLFRGYLLRALEERWSPWLAVTATALLFGLFHTFGLSGLTIERLFPSLLLGLVLGLVAQRSGSVWPGMVLHALNNALLLLIARSRDELVEQGVLAKDSEHLPALWLAVAAGLTLVGLALLVKGRSQK